MTTELVRAELEEGNSATYLPTPAVKAGTAALAAMTDEEFECGLASMRRGRERIARIHRELMEPESDYGVIPGTGGKPTLLKPGAEKLCQFYHLAAAFTPQVQYGDGVVAPPITILTECRLHLGTLDGPVVNTGHGAATSWEKRYRYRRGERICPKCGKSGAILKSKQDDGWFCWAKRNGCGAQFPAPAREIVNQEVGDVENPDPYDLLNTLLKVAEKRAYVDSVLRATATSALYTQDLDEQHVAQEPRGERSGDREAPPAPRPQPASPTPAGPTVGSQTSPARPTGQTAPSPTPPSPTTAPRPRFEPPDHRGALKRVQALWGKLGREDSSIEALMREVAIAADEDAPDLESFPPAALQKAERHLEECLRRERGEGHDGAAAVNGGGAACEAEGCGKPLTEGQMKVSAKAYGKSLCPFHQREQARVA